MSPCRELQETHLASTFLATHLRFPSTSNTSFLLLKNGKKLEEDQEFAKSDVADEYDNEDVDTNDDEEEDADDDDDANLDEEDANTEEEEDDNDDDDGVDDGTGKDRIFSLYWKIADCPCKYIYNIWKMK